MGDNTARQLGASRRALKQFTWKAPTMSTDRVSKAARRVNGSVKEAIGKLTGNKAAEAQGAAEKAAGTPQKSHSALGTRKNVAGTKGDNE